METAFRRCRVASRTRQRVTETSRAFANHVASSADRFTRLEKVAVFLIALGEERTREILADVDLDTIEQLNESMRSLGAVSAEEKASVMLEFAQFFYQDKPISGAGPDMAPPAPPARPRSRPAAESGTPKSTAARGRTKKSATKADQATPQSQPKKPPVEHELKTQKQIAEELAILQTLERLRQRLDPEKIDWGKAGYDFGDGFKGPEEERR